MANAIISGRRYPNGGGAAIPAGSQSFTGNGTFTAPYDGIYTVVLTAGHAASGKGGNGGGGKCQRSGHDSGFSACTGSGGGGGGSVPIMLSPMIGTVSLKAGDSVAITVNTSVVSFGSLLSISNGTSGGNGGMPGYPDTSVKWDPVPATPGAGGNAGSNYSFSADTDHVINVVNPTFSSNANLSGSSGGKGNPVDAGEDIAEQGRGGNPSYGYQCILGGKGGYGGDAIISDDDETWNGETVSNSFIPAATGRIDITWGNQ